MYRVIVSIFYNLSVIRCTMGIEHHPDSYESYVVRVPDNNFPHFETISNVQIEVFTVNHVIGFHGLVQSVPTANK